MSAESIRRPITAATPRPAGTASRPEAGAARRLTATPGRSEDSAPFMVVSGPARCRWVATLPDDGLFRLDFAPEMPKWGAKSAGRRKLWRLRRDCLCRGVGGGEEKGGAPV